MLIFHVSPLQYIALTASAAASCAGPTSPYTAPSGSVVTASLRTKRCALTPSPCASTGTPSTRGRDSGSWREINTRSGRDPSSASPKYQASCALSAATGRRQRAHRATQYRKPRQHRITSARERTVLTRSCACTCYHSRLSVCLSVDIS